MFSFPPSLSTLSHSFAFFLFLLFRLLILFYVQKLILEGVAKSADEPERAYRGYVAIDDLSFAPMGETSVEACHGMCFFIWLFNLLLPFLLF